MFLIDCFGRYVLSEDVVDLPLDFLAHAWSNGQLQRQRHRVYPGVHQQVALSHGGVLGFVRVQHEVVENVGVLLAVLLVLQHLDVCRPQFLPLLQPVVGGAGFVLLLVGIGCNFQLLAHVQDAFVHHIAFGGFFVDGVLGFGRHLFLYV